jgi:hypothetical protein
MLDREVRAMLFADFQARIPGTAENDPFRTERLAELHRDETNRPRPEDQHRLAGNVTAHEIDGPEGRSCSGHHAGLLKRQVVGQSIKCVDMIDGVLGETAVAGETLRPVAFREISVVPQEVYQP